MAFNEWQSRVVAQGANLALAVNDEGTALADGSAGAHDVTLNGGPEITSSYMGLDGLGQYASLAGHTDLAPQDPMTWEAYIKVDQTSPAVSSPGGWFWQYVPDSNTGIQCFINNQGATSAKLWQIAIRLGGATLVANSASGSIQFGTLYHLAATMSSGVLTSYINGVVAATGVSGGSLNQTTTARIGRGVVANRLYGGWIMAIANTKGAAVNQAEITARHELLNPAAIGPKGRAAAQQVVQR